MGSIKQIQTMLEACSNGNRLFPPTILYNEGWMLRLVMNWPKETLLKTIQRS